MYLAKELTQKSLPEIGELFGGRDHTTVLHAGAQDRRRAPAEHRAEPAVARAGTNAQGLTSKKRLQAASLRKGNRARSGTA